MSNGKDIYRYDLRKKQLKKIAYQYKNNQKITFGIAHVHEDEKDRIWIGSRQGLLLLRPGPKTYVLEKLTERDGLPERLVNGIIPDDRGFLWISTMGGLSRLDPEKMVFRNYYASDGLQANEFSYGVFYKGLYDKKLMFGGTAGCNIFDPGSIRDNVILPNTAITGINTVLNNTRLDKLLNARQREGSWEITTTHDEKVLHIDFSALHFAVPERNKYSYYLENFDEGWNAPTSDNFATYTNLKAGSYRFMVKACNKDGLWNEAPTVLWIRVLPPWWKTWWAYAAYIILALFFFGYLYLTQMKRQYQELETKRLAEMDQLKSRLYANITHEFRTPLTVILGLAEQLRDESKDRMIEGLGIIKRNGKNLLALINQMLDLAKLESGGVAVNYVQGDVVGFIEYSLDSFQSLAHSKQITLDFLPRERPFVMDYDAVKLMQIVSNLVSNAIKFTPEEGKVEVKMSIEGEESPLGQLRFIIEVADSGMGIEEEHLDHVFDRFYQADMSNTRQKEGSGIGLALSRELVLLLGGEISVLSKPGAGSVFTVKLPVHREATRAAEAVGLPHNLDFEAEVPAEMAVEVAGFDQELATPLVLVIEDNADVRNYLSNILRKDYRVTVAADGLQGIEKALDIIPDIIISDVMMPGKDGFEVCASLKNDEKTSHVPIIMLTARAAVEDRITGIRQGADAYIAKPFHKAELFAQIENLLEGRKKLHAKFLQYDRPEQEQDIENELDNQFLAKLNKIVEAGSDHEELSIEDVCTRMLMSRMQLHRKIKALTGLSTSIYIRNIRLKRAENILRNEPLNVGEVAYKVGFNDPKYFSRLFTEHFGYPPSDIIQKKS
ncbi:MAG: response regulator [Saprospiraceae bacterium]|nr:response regulator [Saprospiraceae bacterium]